VMDANSLSLEALDSWSRGDACDIEPHQFNDASTSRAKSCRFTVHGKVVGKGRPQFIRKTGAAITPAATRSYESVVRDYAMRAMGDRDPWDAPVAVRMTAVYAIPKSWSKNKRAMALGQLLAPAKPDIDNVVKIVLDSCNRVVYRDDTQVVTCLACKVFGDEPRLIVEFVEV